MLSGFHAGPPEYRGGGKYVTPVPYNQESHAWKAEKNVTVLGETRG